MTWKTTLRISGWLLAALPFAPAMAASVADVPLFLTQKVDPLVMLVLSNDHQLYIKAYTDYDDVDGDGVLDTQYKDAIEYYGYFDSNKCYSHNGNAFAPVRFSPGATATPASHACGGSGEWSGNFLNWASMTRMDVLRKVLFGGARSTDTASSTVLERVFLPRDIHAFAKVFAPANGSIDVRRFTPYADSAITLCNVSDHSSGESQDSGAAPQLRIAAGSWPIWAAGESRQCQWNESGTPDAGDAIATLVARVQACVSDALAEDNCKAYPGGTLKPAGLLQTYGESVDEDAAAMRIGLVSGSYRRNLSGGVLRRNAAHIAGNASAATDEIDSDTGIFINQGDGDAGIINTISRFRISQYDAGNSRYDDCDTYSIDVDELDEGSATRRCGNWGNPVGEMYLETLRYIAGADGPTAAFNTTDASYIDGLENVDWEDPYTEADWCAAPSVIVMSTGLNSFDEDQYSSAADIPAAGGGLDAAAINALTDEIGDLENITGNSYFIGENGSSANQLCDAKTIGALSDAEGICPETPNQDGSYKVAGLAWHAHVNDLRPALGRGGSTNRPSGHELNADTYALALAQGLPRITVNGMTILPACQSNTDGNADNSDGGWLNCSLADLRIVDLVYSGGALVAGDLLYQWEDSSWGNDYDLDGMERITFCAGATCSPAVDDDQVRLTVSSPYAFAGNALRFGYVVTGSTDDGIAFNVVRDGNENFNCLNSDLTTKAACAATQSGSFNGGNNRYPYASVTLTHDASAGGTLNPPLWYAAKYGGFAEDELDANDVPDSTAEWDADGDAVPDGYFQVTDPAELLTKLEDVFESIAKTSSSAASVATNSTRLDVDSAIYQARFNSEDWHGQLLAFTINADGTVGDPKWDAADTIPSHNLRDVFSWNPDPNNDGTLTDGTGIDFYWGNLSAVQQAALNIAPDGANDTLGASRVDWLRGDSSREVRNGGGFRNRSASVLGDIVNSDPFYVGSADFRYHLLPGAEGSSYVAFRNSAAYQSRAETVYVGANDGMLHAFDADTGAERFAYVPDLVRGALAELTDPAYAHRYYVDGSARAGDAYVGGAWKTVLLGTLGAGGGGVFALDVTDPESFSSSDVMWEFNDADLGAMSGQATIVRLNNGDWAALFGNGFESATGIAYLYLVDLESGEIIEKIQAGNATGNGLATPVPVDIDGDRITDFVYAGDLKGKLWKFDLTGNRNQWGVAYGTASNPDPLFTATDDGGAAQPITVRPAVGVHPDGGYMVYFGTGSFYAEGDNVVASPSPVQSFYGIRDTGSAIGGRASLQAQTIDAELIVAGNGARVVSDNSVDYATKRGWYLDLVSPVNGGEGERAVAHPVLRSDRIIFTTLIPSGEPCDFGGSGWLMELDAINGKRLPNTVLDVNEDGTFDEDDFATVGGVGLPVSGMRSSVGIIKSPGIISAGTKEYKYASGSTGEVAVITERNSLDTGRKSWREVN